MRIVKRIFLFLLLLVGVALLAAVFVSKDMHIERSVVINRPADSVFAYIKYLKNQNEYSKWALMDPAMRADFRGTDGQPGFVSSWEGNKDVGKGEQTIRSVDEAARRIDLAVHFIKPFESNATAFMSTSEKGAGSSEVHWGFQTHMPYPMNLMSVLMKGSVEKDLDQGLQNLKAKLEGGQQLPL